MDKEILITNPSVSSNRYAINQNQIDEILENELKDFLFPVKPVYNSRIKDNGRIVAKIFKWGELEKIIKIEIGKQDSQNKEFLIDTLLHEFYEAEIMANQYYDDFYRQLSRAGDPKRHKWIEEKINDFFEKLGEQ